MIVAVSVAVYVVEWKFGEEEGELKKEMPPLKDIWTFC